jgi:gamma-glutamyltranspeptidase
MRCAQVVPRSMPRSPPVPRLSVLYPHMTGLGGDAFWLIYDAGRRRVRYLDGGGRAAAGASVDWFARAAMAEIPFAACCRPR